MPLLASLLLLCAAPHAAPGAETPPAPQAPAPSPEDAAWDAAHELKRTGEYERAAQAFSSFAQTFPLEARATEARVEAGVCWFSVGRARQDLQRNTPGSNEAFARARAAFEGVTRDFPDAPVAGRAQYMRGTLALFSGDLALAEEEYTRGIETYAADAKYLPKCLERRADARRHLLRTDAARADLTRYLREFPAGESVEAARLELRLLGQVERPAPELSAQAWAQGGPLTIPSLQGDVVVVWFFATWCENCEKARPFVLDLVKRYEIMGVKFVGVVDTSKGQTVESVRAFLPAHGIQFPVLMDTGRTVAAYQGRKIPDIVLLDRLGRVRWHDNPANLQDATLELLLTEDPALVPTRR